MTLAQFAMIFWHDLAAPILAGIITAANVGWWRNRKEGENGVQAAGKSICARNLATGAQTPRLFDCWPQ
ncbi:toxic polypeptide [Escherichia coli]|nr:toxic polypeptide [Escherichia coli]